MLQGLRARDAELFVTLVRRELATRYKGALLGALWPLIYQLAQLLVFTFVFSYIFKVRLSLAGVPNSPYSFGAWLFAGLIPWSGLVAGVIQGSNSLVGNQNIVKKVVFPLVLLPLVPVVASFLETIIGLPLLLAFLAIYFHAIHPAAALIVLVWIPQLLLTGGLALLAASLTVFVRDIPLALNPVFFLFFYLTPIVYPESAVPKALLPVLDANPVAGIVAAYRDLFLTGTIAHGGALAYAAIVSVVTFGLGLAVFRALAGRFADEL